MPARRTTEQSHDGSGGRWHRPAAAAVSTRLLAGFLAALGGALLAPPSAAQAGKEGATNEEEEKFKPVDPYTKGDPELERGAGYVSLKPFQWAEGIQASDMVEILGGIDILWAETEHFKICSSLKTYKSKADQKENDALAKEFAVLAKRIPGFKAPRNNKLDPWLRLHLYALRLETLHAEFRARTGFQDSEFPAAGATPNAMGSGPHLGQKLKPTVLLAEKSSALARFARTYSKVDEEREHRALLPGGSMFYGISAESLRDNGFPLDVALHCAIVGGIAWNLADGLRDSHWASPMWLDVGLAHWFSRRIDPRFTYYASGTSRYLDDDLHEWQPRVRGLVDNKFEYSWSDMLSTTEWSEFTPQAHMLIWSRIDWMLREPGSNLRKLMDPLTARLPPGPQDKQKPELVARGHAALKAAFGMTAEECETAWRAWVLKTYARK